jgi:hypothetical protein
MLTSSCSCLEKSKTEKQTIVSRTAIPSGYTVGNSKPDPVDNTQNSQSSSLKTADNASLSTSSSESLIGDLKKF